MDIIIRRRNLMELNQLHYFVAVARCENITRAAKELFITQPALSRVILRLEQELGTPLFDRHGGRVTLNEHGKAFLRYVEPHSLQWSWPPPR